MFEKPVLPTKSKRRVAFLQRFLGWAGTKIRLGAGRLRFAAWRLESETWPDAIDASGAIPHPQIS
jgi:hypothetical protein